MVRQFSTAMPSWRPMMVRLAVSGMAAVALAASSSLGQTTSDASLFRGLEWRNVSNNMGGRATTAVGVRSNPHLYYAGYAGGGLWKTEDGGRSWHNISDGSFDSGSAGDIAVYNQDPSIIYVGTGEAPARGEMSTFGDGMYKSIDAGRTWKHVGLTNTKQIARVLIDPKDPNRVYVAAQGDQWGPNGERGVYRSADGGMTWKRVLFVSDIAGASDLEMDPNNPRVLYAGFWDHQRTPWDFRTIGSGSGLWKSTDGGDTWMELQSGLPQVMGKVRIAVAPSNSNRVYANVEAEDGGIYRSDDAGATWKRVNDTRAVRTRAWYYLGLAVDPGNPDVVYVMGVALLRSEDGGRTFKSVQVRHGDTHSLWINPSNPQNMILTDDGGAEITFDHGATWSPEDNQPTGQFYNVQVDDLFPYNLYGGQQDRTTVKIASRTFGGSFSGIETTNQPAWHSAGGGETGRFAFNPRDPRVVYVTNYWGIIEAYDTQTQISRLISEWPQEPLGTAPRKYKFNWSAALNYSPSKPGVIYHAGTVVFRTEDGGYHWAKISPDLTLSKEQSSTESTIYSVEESPLDPNAIWVGTDGGLIQTTRGGGAIWTNVTPKGAPEGMVTSIELSPHDKATAYAVLSRVRWHDYAPHIYKTTDDGSTWADIAVGLPQNFSARVVREDPVRKDLLYAGTENAVWISFDGGKHWQSLQANLPRVPISDLKVRHDDLIASTEGRSFWILDDITPLHQLSEIKPGDPIALFKPRSAYKIAASGERGPTGLGSPPEGTTIWYWLAATPSTPGSLQLDIIDASDTIVRHITGADPAPEPVTPPVPGGPAVPEHQNKDAVRFRPALTLYPGLNRYLWNFRTAPREGAVGPGGAPFMAGNPPSIGYVLPSGHYTIRMTLGGVTASQPLDILSDPRVSTNLAEEKEHTAMAKAITDRSVQIETAIRQLRSARQQAQSVLDRTKGHSNPERDAAVRTFLDSENAVEEKLLQNRYATGPGTQDFLSYPPGLVTEYSYLLGLVDGSAGPLTQAERDRFADLESQWQSLRSRANEVLTTDLQRVNGLLATAGVSPGISVKQEKK